MSSASHKAFSAPGKALLAGGYLVLDQQYDSYVVALSSRMHAVVSSSDSDSDLTTITVSSPQFKNGLWKYSYTNKQLEPVSLLESKNPFVQSTILNVLAFINPSESKSIEITIFSDPGYHSQQDITVKTSPTNDLKFSFHNDEITKVAKTGLGSSAGLVTVLTTALLSVYRPIDTNSIESLTLIHNLSQISHCQAQGKVGSGFDVAAATFGSIVYKRFDPSLINNLNLTSSHYREEIKSLVLNTNWEIKNERVALPHGIRLIMGDIKGGSNTPKLVAKVNEWKKSDSESSEIFNTINESNLKLIKCLFQLNEMYKEDPKKYSELLSLIHNSTSEELRLLTATTIIPELISSILTIRSSFRTITERSGADIEPPQQTELLNQCNKIKGVIGGVDRKSVV